MKGPVYGPATDFRVRQHNFREFVRIDVNGGVATPTQTAWGSRASSKYLWQSRIQARRGEETNAAGTLDTSINVYQRDGISGSNFIKPSNSLMIAPGISISNLMILSAGIGPSNSLQANVLVDPRMMSVDLKPIVIGFTDTVNHSNLNEPLFVLDEQFVQNDVDVQSIGVFENLDTTGLDE